MVLFSQEKRKRALTKKTTTPANIFYFTLPTESRALCVCVCLNICMEMCLLLLQAFVEVDSGDVRTGLSYPFLQIFFQPANTHRAFLREQGAAQRSCKHQAQTD